MNWSSIVRRAAIVAAAPALVATTVAAVAQHDPIHGGAPAQEEAAAEAPAAPITIWDGAYTEEQAERGFEQFRSHGCGGCHGDDMKGTPGGPNLTGFLFMFHWGEMPATGVFDFMQNNMPPGAAGSLSSQAYADVLAAIFRANEFPAGEVELDPENLESVLIVPAEE